jgi:hypothetical protein
MTVFGILLAIALMHAFRVGQYLEGQWHIYYYSFFSDLILPFGMYFLLCLNEWHIPLLRRWTIKSGLVFGAAAAAETLQAFGIACLGETFDPLDYGMYAMGAAAAALFDRQVFRRILPYWALNGSSDS